MRSLRREPARADSKATRRPGRPLWSEMKPVLLRVAMLIGVVTVLVALARSAPTWKLFSSHGGWDMRYPSGWHISSCRSCTDPKASGVFVNFSPPSGHGGSVMVEPLADKPSSKDVDEWLSEVAKTNNWNPHGREEKMILNGLAALKVRYRTAAQGEM